VLVGKAGIPLTMQTSLQAQRKISVKRAKNTARV